MTKLILAIHLVGVAAVTLFAGFNYSGEWYYYILFTIVANALLLNGFQRRALFFDTFIGIFLWLGFWLKFSLRIGLGHAYISEAIAFTGSPEAFDHALIVSTCGLTALLFASLIRQRFFIYPQISATCEKSGLFLAYQKYRIQILGAFAAVVIIVAISNALLGIYQRGMVAQTILPFGLNGIYKWLLQFGLSTVSALIIRYEIELNRSLTAMAFIPAIFETFLSNVSLLSRGMVLNSTGLAIGAWRALSSMNIRVGYFRAVAVASIFLLFFAFSVLTVNYLRAKSYGEAVNVKAESPIALTSEVKSMTTPLFLERWVGIEGVFAVSSAGDLGWNLWREAWQERFREGELSLYDRRFINSPYRNTFNFGKPLFHFVSLPGIIAFMYYPGSLPFLFGALMLCGLLAAVIEIYVYQYAGRNLVLSSLIAQVVAYRYAHFGYVPAQSYLLFGTLLLNVLIVFIADRVLWRYIRVPSEISTSDRR